MTDATVSLVLGDFYLHGGESDEWTVDVIADGVDWGSPAGVDAAVQTLLQNSTLVMRERYDNREVTFKVRIRAADGVILAAAEAALFAELGKPNEMVWTPPAAYSPPTVFRVVMSDMEPDVDDLAELRCERTYSLHFVCEAFNRSVDEIITEAEFQPVDGGGDPVTPIDTLVDDCSSATKWSSIHGAVTVSGGVSVYSPVTGVPDLTRADSVTPIDMTSTPYLVVDAKVTGGGKGVVRMGTDGSWILPDAIGNSPYASLGYTRYWFKPGLSSIVRFTIACDVQPATGRLYINEVRKQNTPPATGTFRQKFFTADVQGSAPSDGSIEVYHDTDPLSDVLLYTWPPDGQAFTPALRPLLSASGTTTTDAGLASGARNDLAATAVSYDIPAAQITVGSYEVGALLRCSSTGAHDVQVTVATLFGSTVVSTTTFTKSVNFAVSSAWSYVPLGRLELPLSHVNADTSAVTRVTLASPDASGIDVDETYLFNIESGALTVIDCGSATHLWLNAATLDWPMPSVMLGTLADGTDAYTPEEDLQAPGVHRISPPSINVFALTRGALDAGVRLIYTPAWHTNAGL